MTGIEKYGIINIDINTNTVDGTRIIEEIRVGDNELVYLYGADGSPVGMRYNGTAYYYGKNLFGDIVDIYNVSGTKVAHYAYDAWGNHTVTNYGEGTIGDINPFRYRGYYYDTETGFYYLGARYYDPVIGRFISADTINYLGSKGGFRSYNLYTYCANNPIMYTDPTGHDYEWWNPAVWDWAAIADVLIGIGAIVAGIAVGIAVGTFVAGSLAALGVIGLGIGVVAGIAAGMATVGIINNAVNAVYYTYFSDGEASHVGTNSYTTGYVSRWDRLDYTKAMLRQAGYDTSYYDLNAWKYYSEYNVHMVAYWILSPIHNVLSALGWHDSPFFDVVERAKKADVIPGVNDSDWKVQIATIIFAILGW